MLYLTTYSMMTKLSALVLCHSRIGQQPPDTTTMTPLEAISHAPHHSLHHKALHHLNADQRTHSRRVTRGDRALSTPETPVKRLGALPETEIVKYFHLSPRDAARALGVGTITLKRICKQRDIEWPKRIESIEQPTSSETGVSSASNEMRSRL